MPAADVEPVARLDWPQALAWRLHRQHLDRRAAPDAVLEIARDLCGLHAQVMSSAELTVWARTESLRRDAVSEALWRDRTLVKFWAMRGTLHLVRADEFGLFSGALSTYDHFLKPQWLRYFETSREELEALFAHVRDVLHDRRLTREELALAVEAKASAPNLGEKLRTGWGSFLKPPSFRGDLCFAPNEGRNVTFTSPETWIGPFERDDPRASLRALFRSFIRTYGPVTRQAIARWWGGLSPAGAERVVRELGDEVVRVDVEGALSWMLAEDVAAAVEAEPKRVVNLLPAFDQYVVTAPRDTPQVLDPALKERVYRKAAWLSQVLLTNGRIVGVWTHERKGKRLRVTIDPFEKLPAWVRKGAEREAKRLQEYLGGDLSLEWT